ncbi:MAG: hypothetical protein GVY24_03315 [Planctomycetes bacterium]|nr:hypothetical protein [Planctomycetota bacterium]
MDTNTTSLRELIAGRIDARWDAWAEKHPHLAQTIDRVRLIDATVTRLRHDPAFNDALRQADLDEATLLRAAKVIDVAEGVIGRLLRW